MQLTSSARLAARYSSPCPTRKSQHREPLFQQADGVLVTKKLPALIAPMNSSSIGCNRQTERLHCIQIQRVLVCSLPSPKRVKPHSSGGNMKLSKLAVCVCTAGLCCVGAAAQEK